MKKSHGAFVMKEVNRVKVVRSVLAKRLSQGEAAERLGLGDRQVRRLLTRYREHGAAGLISVRRGRRPNNAIGAGVREGIMALVQIDGSPHAWFEGRGPPCTLIVFVDDATSRLLALRFEPAETTAAYMRVMRGYLGTHGRPVAVCSDRHSIFRVNRADREGDVTQFTRVLKTLDIEPIHARSTQAKGRVERANQTLQDRLVKELRLRGVSDMESANAYLPEYMADYNRRFAVAPREPGDAHREVPHDDVELDLIHCLHATRTLSKNLTFRYARREYQLVGRGRGHRLRAPG